MPWWRTFKFFILGWWSNPLCLGGELFYAKVLFILANKSNTFVPLNMFSKLTQSHHASVIPWDKHGEEKNIQGLSSPKLCSSALFQNDDKH